jgi:hypothetical protein
MSKQSEAKAAQGYVAKAVPRTCANCAKFLSDKVQKTSEWMKTTWVEEKNLRCGIGGFAVKKNGTCNLYSVKE